MDKLISPKLSYNINGILFNVHNERGQYCNEQQYCDAIEEYLKVSGLSYEREKVLPVSFKNEVEGRNKIDFLIQGLDGDIILEIKAKKVVTKEDYYQVKRYLVAFDKKLGILVNFHAKYITPKRILNSSTNS